MTRGKGFVCVHFPQDGEFGDAVRKTRFGQFIEGTEYADYSIGNQFRDNGASMLGNKTPDHKYCFTLETDGGTFLAGELGTLSIPRPGMCRPSGPRRIYGRNWYRRA